MRKPENPSAARAGQRPLTLKEEIQRHAAAACSGTSGMACEKNVHLGIFLDGTNNNMGARQGRISAQPQECGDA
jgi:hypothetical protein